jgi:hypothetical protein
VVLKVVQVQQVRRVQQELKEHHKELKGRQEVKGVQVLLEQQEVFKVLRVVKGHKELKVPQVLKVEYKDIQEVRVLRVHKEHKVPYKGTLEDKVPKGLKGQQELRVDLKGLKELPQVKELKG